MTGAPDGRVMVQGAVRRHKTQPTASTWRNDGTSMIMTTREKSGSGSPSRNAPLTDRSRSVAAKRLPASLAIGVHALVDVGERLLQLLLDLDRLLAGDVPRHLDARVAPRDAPASPFDSRHQRTFVPGGTSLSIAESAEDGVAAGGQDHALRLDAADRRRLQVGDEDDRLADERLGRVGLGDAGHDLALLARRGRRRA